MAAQIGADDLEVFQASRLVWQAREPAGVNACPAVVGDTLLVGAGAEPSGIRTPTPQLTAYRLE